MAAIIKLRQLPVIQRCVWNHLNKISRGISTSDKNRDSAATVDAASSPKVDKNWVSYGFDFQDQEEDTNVHHASFFFSITLCIVFGGFAWTYSPDTHMRDWTQREAFLELRRREKNGLRPIDPNLVDPANVSLPSDSELSDIEIII